MSGEERERGKRSQNTARRGEKKRKEKMRERETEERK